MGFVSIFSRNFKSMLFVVPSACRSMRISNIYLMSDLHQCQIYAPILLQNIKSPYVGAVGRATSFKLQRPLNLLCSKERHSIFSSQLLAHSSIVLIGSSAPNSEPQPGTSPSSLKYPAGQLSGTTEI